MGILFKAVHPDHGECLCDDFAFERRVAVDDKWKRVDEIQKSEPATKPATKRKVKKIDP